MSTKTYLKTINDFFRDNFVQNVPGNENFTPNVCTLHTEIKDKFIDLALICDKDHREKNFARDLHKRVQNLMRSKNTREMLDVNSLKIQLG